MSTVEDLSYRAVLRNRRLGALLAGDLTAYLGNGIVLVALPIQTLLVHGATPAALAIAAVGTSSYLLGTVVAFVFGLSSIRLSPRTLLLADCLLRSVVLGALGLLALHGDLTLWTLAGGLLVGSALRLVGSSSRRLLATGMAGPEGLFAVNGLLGTGSNLALYVIGPVLGGVLVSTMNPGVALLIDAGCSLVLLTVVLLAVPAQPAATTGTTASSSGWRILHRFPVAARLFIVVFFFNLFYMPVEIALPLLVQGQLHSGGGGLGVLWGGFGVGALIGAVLTGHLRRLPRITLLVGIIAGWAAAVVMLALAPDLLVATAAFAVGGLIWAPFTPVAFSLVQSLLSRDEQQPVVVLWTAGGTVAAPVGLALGGPLIQLAGTRGGLLVSAALTLALVPLAVRGLRQAEVRQDR
ncbi:MAG TPA: MFS transporter [Actinoplanes sp.]|nr:MFS transporter [Actinoplanes sp.]